MAQLDQAHLQNVPQRNMQLSTIVRLESSGRLLTLGGCFRKHVEFQQVQAHRGAQFLQQAGTSCLAQANQIAQNVLSLLG